MLEKILAELAPFGARLVAVSKTKPPEAILELYQKGQRIFGENKPQELAIKQKTLPLDIEWHLIGHLQTNKVKLVAPFVACIHSVDSARLLETIDREALKAGRCIDCLLQFHIADEPTKFGFDEPEAIEMLRSGAFSKLRNVRIVGVMGMATFTDDPDQIRSEFSHLRRIFERLRKEFFSEKPFFRELSMGMSSDFAIALQEGSTLVRIGSLLFGSR